MRSDVSRGGYECFAINSFGLITELRFAWRPRSFAGVCVCCPACATRNLASKPFCFFRAYAISNDVLLLISKEAYAPLCTSFGLVGAEFPCCFRLPLLMFLWWRLAFPTPISLGPISRSPLHPHPSLPASEPGVLCLNISARSFISPFLSHSAPKKATECLSPRDSPARASEFQVHLWTSVYQRLSSIGVALYR